MATASTSTAMEEVVPELNSSGPADVDCSSCIGRKRKAEQFCLQCSESYCDFHLDLHNTLHVGKRHKLMEPCIALLENMCVDHGRRLEVYCRTDQKCICHLCITDKHTGHHVISMQEEVASKQGKLWELQKKAIDIIEAKEKDVQALKQAIEVFRASANKALVKNEKSFTELIQFMKDNQNKVTALIQGQAESAVKQAEGFVKTLQQEISIMRTRNADLHHLDLLSQSNNDVRFLQSAVFMPLLTEYKQSFVFHVHPYNSFERDSMFVDELVKKLNTTSKQSLLRVSRKVKNTRIVTSPPPKTQKEFLQYATKLSFNTNSAHKYLVFRKDNQEVMASNQLQDYPEHTQRFNCRTQILCNEALRGSSKYWEVEFDSTYWVCIAVSYQGIRRKGKHRTLLGRNAKSWGLRCNGVHFQFWHDNKTLFSKCQSHGSKIGVYLNYRAGVLAFYSVSGVNMSLIYKHKTVFKEPVYAGFGLAGKGSYVKLCNPVKTETKASLPSPFKFESKTSSFFPFKFGCL
ncbi:tripartite motif-containing protein 16 [Danio aesculapii]|uniref:tripartite motif-containing protein 16 n=1 Tax=Danio aesculapii TaxID=1142201 RepID=UPI0024BFCBE9|nr:tripartite motif-containing protein 16 [Danio aesculapii]